MFAESRSFVIVAAGLLFSGIALVPPVAIAAIHVASSGSDLNPGTAAAPVKTIAQGIALAAGPGEPVHIAQGVYNETIQLVGGVDLIGGFSVDGGVWTRNPVLHPTILWGGKTAVLGDADNDILLDGLVIRSTAGDFGNSSIAVFLKSCQDVFLVGCRLEPGNGGPGTSGNSGVSGGTGGNGQPGQPGCENATPFCDTCARPIGGAGGVNGWGTGGGKGGNAGQSDSTGSAGTPGGGSGAGAGGPGVPSAFQGDLSPYLGLAGSPGFAGPDGSGGASSGLVNASGYIAASGQSGSAGTHGSGGGGGGGGGGGILACDSYGSSGGGGGAGGERGRGGFPGGGGGGSFGVVLFACDQVTIQDCALVTGTGGAGGAGGFGGTGGAGGSAGAAGAYGGSNEQDDASNGAPGGRGGRGGDGGHGGGGGGGPTIGIWNEGAGAVFVGGNTYTLGTPGAGGGGPVPGANGLTEQVHGLSAPVAVGEDVLAVGALALSAAPNPFQGSTRIHYTLTRDARVSLGVYDLRGARVTTLVEQAVLAGPHSTMWDGRDRGGARAPAGIYFVRLACGGETRQTKVVITN